MDQPKLAHIETVSTGWLNKYLLTYEREDGSTFAYEGMSRKRPQAYADALAARGLNAPEQCDAVCIIGVTPDNQVLLIKEFRYPLNAWCLAFPAGLVDPGEDLATCVERELAEETGFRLVPGTQVRPLAQPGFSSTGMTDETVHIVFAQVEPAGKPHTEENELIEAFTLPCANIRSFLDANTLAIGTRCQLGLELLAAQAAQTAQVVQAK